MARHDEIQSTEKLLELIRSQDPIDSPPTEESQTNLIVSRRPAKKSISAAVRLRKKLVIGVDIGHTYIKLAKIQHNSDKSAALSDYLDLPLQKPVSLKDPELLQLLKKTMQQFCGTNTNLEIWSAIASANVETRFLLIPKLPAKQIHNAVFWTFSKKVPFNPNDEVLDYEILGDITDSGVKKIEVMAYKAPKEEIETLKTAFESIGYPLSGITVIPFAVQNLFRSDILPSTDENVCSLFVGRDWSRITVYNSANLVLSRGIKAGMRSMIEAIDLRLNQRSDGWDEGSDETLTLENRHSERSATIDPASQKLFFDFIATSTNAAAGSNSLQGYSVPQVFQMLLPAMERLIRQIERTFEHYSLNFHHEGIRRIYISGPITSSKLVVDHIGKQLDLPIMVMDPFADDDAFAEQVNIPNSAAERESYVPAIGLALSNNQRTPNFLFTHQDKEQEERARGNNMRVLTICLVCLILLIAFFSWQERRLDDKRAAVAKLNNQLLAYNPPAEKNNLMALYANTKNKHQAINQMAKRYAPVAVINELARLTPSHVRLLNVDAAFNATQQPNGNIMGTVAIQGVIFGESNALETALTSYLFSLRNSQLFNKPNIINKQEAYYNGQRVLRFNAKLDIL